MKKLIINLFLGCFLFYFGCQSENDKSVNRHEEENMDEPTITEDDLEYGKLLDPRDKQRYNTVRMADGRIWMAENMKYNTNESICPNNNQKECDKLGRLYSQEGAKEACNIDGWKLPNDKEWTNLIEKYGKVSDGYFDMSNSDDSKSAFFSIVNDTKFNIQFAGAYYKRKFFNVHKVGNYWGNAYKYSFDRKIRQNRIIPESKNSCRCIKKIN